MPLRSLILALSIAALQAQAPPRTYLEPTSHYLQAARTDLSELPPPPAPGSLAARADLETILQLQAWRTPEQEAFARRVDNLDAFDAAEVLGPWFRREALPRCARLLDEVLGDGEAMNHAAKLIHRRLRPFAQDPRVKPCTAVWLPKVEPPPAPYYSYPSGHATSIHLLARVLSDLEPGRAGALETWAHRASWSRMIAGVHFPSDAVGGALLAGITYRTLMANPAFRESLEACRKEYAAHRP